MTAQFDTDDPLSVCMIALAICRLRYASQYTMGILL